MPTTSPNPSSVRATKNPTTTLFDPRGVTLTPPARPPPPPPPRCRSPPSPALRERVGPSRRAGRVRAPLALGDRVTGEVFEHAHQPRMVPALAAEGGGGVEQLLGGRRIGQGETEGARSLQGEVQILL